MKWGGDPLNSKVQKGPIYSKLNSRCLDLLGFWMFFGVSLLDFEKSRQARPNAKKVPHSIMSSTRSQRNAVVLSFQAFQGFFHVESIEVEIFSCQLQRRPTVQGDARLKHRKTHGRVCIKNFFLVGGFPVAISFCRISTAKFRNMFN